MDSIMSQVASGSFEVTLTPQPAGDHPDDSAVGRLTIDKQFHGDLSATSRGQMLAARTAVDNSAGYVAIERVTGALGGRSGSFVLQHTGVMDRGASQLQITIVPDSATDELAGLAGTMSIGQQDGKHSYTLRYTLPDTAS